MATKIEKSIKVKKFLVLKCWMFSFEGSFLYIGHPLWRPRIKLIGIFDKTTFIFVSAVNFFQFLVMKTMDLGP